MWYLLMKIALVLRCCSASRLSCSDGSYGTPSGMFNSILKESLTILDIFDLFLVVPVGTPCRSCLVGVIDVALMDNLGLVFMGVCAHQIAERHAAASNFLNA
jgi:hypothetical protein